MYFGATHVKEGRGHLKGERVVRKLPELDAEPLPLCPYLRLAAFCATWFMGQISVTRCWMWCLHNTKRLPNYYASYFVIGISKYRNLSFILEEISWPASRDWTPKNFTIVSGPWIFVRFIFHVLEQMCLTHVGIQRLQLFYRMQSISAGDILVN